MQHIIDSHIHFWHPEQLAYSWLESVPAINRTYTPADVSSAGNNWVTDGLVFVEADVQPGDGLREVEWVAAFAKTDPRLQGIVAFAPLHEGDAARNYLDQLRTIPLVKGVRRLIQGEPAGFCL